MPVQLKVLSNAVTADQANVDTGGGFSKVFYYPLATISAGTTVTQMPFFIVPRAVTNARVTNVYLATGGTAPSVGTMTVTVKKNGATSVTTTAPAVTTTAGVNTNVNANSSATTGYTIPVMVSPPVTLVAGDSLTYDISGGATVTLQSIMAEVQDMSGVS